MDPKLIYLKTPTGDEAIRQSAHVVKRELRMVLVQVDGKVTVEQLAVKLGNRVMVEEALADLEARGLVAPSDEAVAVWEHSRMQADEFAAASSRFSGFVPKSSITYESGGLPDPASRFSVLRPPLAPAFQLADPEPEMEPKQDSRRARSTFSKVLGGLVLLVVGVLVIALMFPYERFKPDVEAAMGRLLQDTVQVESLGVALWPRPQLVLGGVSVGNGGDFNISEMRIDAPLSWLSSGPAIIPVLRLTGARIGVDKFVALPMFLSADSPLPGPRIAKILVNQLQFTARDLSIGELSGRVLFKPDGRLEKASFQTVDRSLSIDALPAEQGVALEIEGAALKIPGSELGFESIQAKGLLQKDRLILRSLDGFLLGGSFKGSCSLAWGGNLTAAWDGVFRLLDGRRVSAALAPSLKLEGDLSGNLALRSQGGSWAALLNNAEASVDLDIRRGMLYGVDLGEAARKPPGSVVRAGATKFDRFVSVLSVTPERVTTRDLRLESGMMTASGQFQASRNRQVDAALIVTFQSSVSTLRIPLHVHGALPELSVTSGK